jgi:hypothetical protein
MSSISVSDLAWSFLKLTGKPSTVLSKQYMTVALLVRSSVSHSAIFDAISMHSSSFSLCTSCTCRQSMIPVT